MQIRINKLHFPVTTLGVGRRIGIWFQGCRIRCPGCLSKDTWPHDARFSVDIETVLDWCREQGTPHPDGVTISGGEPFEQPRELDELLGRLHRWRKELGKPIDFLCYSGLPLARLRRDFGGILDKLDALIPEPFVRGRPTNLPWRGSANQPLVLISRLGREKYSAVANREVSGSGQFQVQVQHGKVWFIGIPRPDDMLKLDDACKARGVVQKDVSWRA